MLIANWGFWKRSLLDSQNTIISYEVRRQLWLESKPCPVTKEGSKRNLYPYTKKIPVRIQDGKWERITASEKLGSAER